jgi:hypothetical protein
MAAGEPGALLVITTEADCAPVAIGAKVMLIEQLDSAGTFAQLFVWEKLALPLPVIWMVPTINAEAPVLVSAKTIGVDVVPTVCGRNETEFVDKLTAGGLPPIHKDGPAGCPVPVTLR